MALSNSERIEDGMEETVKGERAEEIWAHSLGEIVN